MLRAKETALTLFIMYISPLKQKLWTHPCALHKFDALRHILVIFGRNEEEDQ